MKRHIIILLPFLIIFCLSQQISATSLTIINPGFEAISLSNGSWVYAATGWNVSSFAGTFNPTTVQYPGGAPEGINVGFSRDGGTLSQTLSAVLTENKKYTLTLFAGHRLDNSTDPNTDFTIALRLAAGGATLSELIQPIKTMAPGTFMQFSLNYNALPGDPLLGQNLEIFLTTVDTQANFDDVRLTTSVIPEPGTFLLLGAGLLSLVGFRFQRRKKI